MTTPYLSRVRRLRAGSDGPPLAGAIRLRRRSRFEPLGLGGEAPALIEGVQLEPSPPQASTTEAGAPPGRSAPAERMRPATARSGPAPGAAAAKPLIDASGDPKTIVEQLAVGTAHDPLVVERTGSRGPRAAHLRRAAADGPTTGRPAGQQPRGPFSNSARVGVRTAAETAAPEPRPPSAPGRNDPGSSRAAVSTPPSGSAITPASPPTDASLSPHPGPPVPAEPPPPPPAPATSHGEPVPAPTGKRANGAPRADATAPVLAKAAALAADALHLASVRGIAEPRASHETEVTVTIGRLEVRTQPAAPAHDGQPRAPRQRPTSLDAYLRSRATGRSG